MVKCQFLTQTKWPIVGFTKRQNAISPLETNEQTFKKQVGLFQFKNCAGLLRCGLLGFLFGKAITCCKGLVVNEDLRNELAMMAGAPFFKYFKTDFFALALRPFDDKAFKVYIVLDNAVQIVMRDELADNKGARKAEALIEVNSAHECFERVAVHG